MERVTAVERLPPFVKNTPESSPGRGRRETSLRLRQAYGATRRGKCLFQTHRTLGRTGQLPRLLAPAAMRLARLGGAAAPPAAAAPGWRGAAAAAARPSSGGGWGLKLRQGDGNVGLDVLIGFGNGAFNLGRHFHLRFGLGDFGVGDGLAILCGRQGLLDFGVIYFGRVGVSIQHNLHPVNQESLFVDPEPNVLGKGTFRLKRNRVGRGSPRHRSGTNACRRRPGGWRCR